MCFFDPKIWIYGAKTQFYVLESRFLSKGHTTIDQYTRATIFQFGPPHKKISVSEVWVIFRGLPWFLTVSGHSHFAGEESSIFLNVADVDVGVQENLTNTSVTAENQNMITTAF